MNLSRLLVVLLAVGFLAAAIFSFALFTVPVAIIILLLMIVFGLVFYFRLLQPPLILIDEMEVGVVFNRCNGKFERFIVSPDPDQVQKRRGPSFCIFLFGQPVLAYNDPFFVRLRPYERLDETRIPKKSQTTKGELTKLRTKEGILIDIDWSISYFVSIDEILPIIQHKMARALPKFSDKVVSGRAVRALKHIIEQKTIEELYKEGALRKLEEEVRRVLNETLNNLGFKEISSRDVKLGPIKIPPNVEKALESAHQRKLQTSTAVSALNDLKAAIENFNDADMRRLAELERLRILDEKTSSLVYMTDASVRSEKEQIHTNGQIESPTIRATPGPTEQRKSA